MPTVLRQAGFSVRIYPNDHDPPHVHVFKAGGEVKATIAETPALLDVINMSNKDVKKALELIQNHRQELLEKWSDFYAND